MTRVVWNLTSFYLETVLVLVQKGSWFALDVPQAHKSFLTYPMVTLGYKAQVEAHFGPFGDSANLDAR